MKLLLYCTKSKPYLLRIKKEQVDFMCNYKQWLIDSQETYKRCAFNGKIVAECDFEVEEIKHINLSNHNEYRLVSSMDCFKLYNQSCLSFTELNNYLKGNKGYAIHIKNLHIFDEPKELKEFYKIENVGGMLFTKQLTKAPQNMMRVSIKDWEYMTYTQDDIRVLISIHPEWLFKKLNGEKTIEVRRIVLKEML